MHNQAKYDRQTQHAAAHSLDSFNPQRNLLVVFHLHHPRRGGGEAGRRRGGGLAAGRWRGWPAAGSRGGRAGWARRTTRANTARETSRAGGWKNYGGGQERSGTKSPSRRQFFPLPCAAWQYFPRAAAFPAVGAFHACWTAREQISARFCACYAQLRGDALLRERLRAMND